MNELNNDLLADELLGSDRLTEYSDGEVLMDKGDIFDVDLLPRFEREVWMVRADID